MAAGFTPPKYHTDFAPDLVVEGIPDDPLSQPKVATPSMPAHAPGRRCLCAARALGRRRRVRPARAHALPARAPQVYEKEIWDNPDMLVRTPPPSPTPPTSPTSFTISTSLSPVAPNLPLYRFTSGTT